MDLLSVTVPRAFLICIRSSSYEVYYLKLQVPHTERESHSDLIMCSPPCILLFLPVRLISYFFKVYAKMRDFYLVLKANKLIRAFGARLLKTLQYSFRICLGILKLRMYVDRRRNDASVNKMNFFQLRKC